MNHVSWRQVALEALCGRISTIADEAFGPFSVQPADDSLTAIERGIFELRRERDAAIARADRAEAELARRDTAVRALGADITTGDVAAWLNEHRDDEMARAALAVLDVGVAATERAMTEGLRARAAEQERDAAIARAEAAERERDELAVMERKAAEALRRELGLAPRLPETHPDDADSTDVLEYLAACADGWAGDARILGNARARDVARACRTALADRERARHAAMTIGERLYEVGQGDLLAWLRGATKDNGDHPMAPVADGAALAAALWSFAHGCAVACALEAAADKACREMRSGDR